MDAPELLNQLAADLGIAELRFDANHACGLAFAGGLQIDLHHVEHDQVLHLAALIGPVQGSGRPELMTTLLAANQHPGELAEAHFALDSAHDAVVLCRTLLASELATLQLSAEVNRLVDVARHWREELGRRQLAVIDG